MIRTICYLLFSYLIILSCTSQTDQKEVKPEQYASLSDTTKYVGITVCKQCHADKFETFSHTGMGKSFDLASRKKSSAVFDGHLVILDKYKDLSYTPFWNQDTLYLREFRLKNKDTIFNRVEKISYIVGSGQHTNSHIININGYLYQAPATFYTQKGKWDLPPGFEGGFNSRFDRKIELECMTCHNALPEIVKGSENKFTDVPSGIDCERCHGPGSLHVRLKQSGLIVDVTKEIDYSIVNPAKLPVERQLDVCQRCHIQGNAVLRDSRSFYDFRPGMKLSDVMNVFMPVYKGDEDAHIMASHAERMKMSSCFKVSIEKAEKYNEKHPSLKPYTNAMTCVTCHNPHVSVRSTDPEVFNNACRSCHGNEAKKITASSIVCSAIKEERMAVNDNCTSCHMPKNGSIDIPHVRVTDHWIRKPVKKEEVKKIREFVTLACINNKEVEPIVRGQAYLSYFEKFVSNPAFLDSAKRYIPDRSNDDVRMHFRDLIRWSFLENDFPSVVGYLRSVPDLKDSLRRKDYSNTDAWTAYRLGESLRQLGQYNEALFYHLKACELAPYDLDFRGKLALLQDNMGKYREARSTYEFILSENPDLASVHVNYGFLLLRLENNPSKARHHYEQALALDPDNVQAMINMAGIFVYMNDMISARNYLQRALKADPNNAQAKQLLMRLKA